MYQLVLRPGVTQAVNRLPDGVRRDIQEEILGLKEDPVPPYSLRMREPYLEQYRIRVGRYRVIYEIKEEEKQVVIWSVKKRSSST